MISLLAWSKLVETSYSNAYKLFDEGRINGAIRIGSRIKVPETAEIPPRPLIACQICGKQYPQITGTHLKLHQISVADYKASFPDAEMISSDIGLTISEKLSGRTLSDLTKERVSKSRSGIPAWNKGQTGIYTASDETKAKMSAAQTGRVHSTETKKKIGDGNRGKIMSPEAKKKAIERQADYYAYFGGPNKGVPLNPEFRARMSAIALEREANYTRAQREAINKAIGDGGRGVKRTPEQKERYRTSRVKWMSENPTKVINSSGERTVAEWLDKHRIIYRRQFVIPGIYHPYDFFLPDHDTIIEFDGAHHWWRPWFKVLGKTKEERAELLRLQMAKDAMENLAAGLSGYRIIRIIGVADAGDSTEHGSLEHQLRLQGFDMPY